MINEQEQWQHMTTKVVFLTSKPKHLAAECKCDIRVAIYSKWSGLASQESTCAISSCHVYI